MTEDKLYIPISGVKFADLFDWSDVSQKCNHISTVINNKGIRRQNSQTGNLVDCNEEKIAVFRYDNRVYAIKETCPHAGGPLHLGDIEDLPSGGLCIRCPWHSWKFDLDTGQVMFPKGRNMSTKVYPIKVNIDGTLSIGFDKLADAYFNMDYEF